MARAIPNVIGGNANNSFGTQIRVYRITRGWTQKYVANRLGVSGSFLSKLERGKVNLSNQPSLRKLFLSRL